MQTQRIWWLQSFIDSFRCVFESLQVNRCVLPHGPFHFLPCYLAVWPPNCSFGFWILACPPFHLDSFFPGFDPGLVFETTFFFLETILNHYWSCLPAAFLHLGPFAHCHDGVLHKLNVETWTWFSPNCCCQTSDPRLDLIYYITVHFYSFLSLLFLSLIGPWCNDFVSQTYTFLLTAHQRNTFVDLIYLTYMDWEDSSTTDTERQTCISNHNWYKQKHITSQAEVFLYLTLIMQDRANYFKTLQPFFS